MRSMLARRVSAGTRTIQDTSTRGAADIPKSTLTKLLFPGMHRARIPTTSPYTSSLQKTIPSHRTPRTIKSCAPESAVCSRASVLCWSFFVFSQHHSALRAAPSLPAIRQTPTNSRQPFVIISRSILTTLPCWQARLLSPASRQIPCSQLSPQSSPGCSPQIPILTGSLQSRILRLFQKPRS